MANWVRFSDRLPTEDDMNYEGEVVIQHEDGMLSTAWPLLHNYKTSFWLENIPELPKPRTLEDVAKALVKLYEAHDYNPCLHGYRTFHDLMEDLKQITNPKLGDHKSE